MTTPISSMPTCPSWPWTYEQDRIDAVSARDELLRDAHEETLHAFLEKVWGPKKRAVVGLLDTSWNPLRTWAQQMSTPGLYSVRPTTRGPEGTDGLVGEKGLLDRARWAPTMQHVEYQTRGLGDMFVRPVVRNGKVGLVQVKPWAVHVETDPADPSRATELWERCLYRDQERRWAWVYEVWDVSDPENPSWRVLSADQVGRDGQLLPVANLYYPDTPAEGLVGDAYTWRFSDGEPHVPHVHFRSKILPGYWSWETMRGLHRGTFQCARLSNGLLYAADMASHRAVLLTNCIPVGSERVNIGTAGTVSTQEILPGSMVPLMALDASNNTMAVTEVGPGMDVASQWSVVRSYTLSMLASHGLRESDVVRAEANPTSAAALIVSDASRREAQRQLAPLFEESDRELIRKIAALARVHGLGTYPDEDIYDVSYSLISKTSDELQAEREEEDFELQHGLTSTVALYMKRKGVDRPTAIRELKRVQADEAELMAPGTGAPPVPPTADMATENDAAATDPTYGE